MDLVLSMAEKQEAGPEDPDVAVKQDALNPVRVRADLNLDGESIRVKSNEKSDSTAGNGDLSVFCRRSASPGKRR